MAVWRTPPPAPMEVLDGAVVEGEDGAMLQFFGDGADESGKMMIL